MHVSPKKIAVPNDRRDLTEWEYHALPVDAPSAAFGPFKDIVSIWRSKTRPNVRIPARSEIDFYDLKPWLGKISIAKIEPDPFSVQFVLWGTELTKWWGVDYTQQPLGTKSEAPDAWQRIEGAYFAQMMKEPFIGIVGGTLDKYGRPFIKVLGIDLPLLENGLLSHVLSVHFEILPDASAMTVLPDFHPQHTF